MMIADPQMHANPPKKAEEHPKRAKLGKKGEKVENAFFLK